MPSDDQRGGGVKHDRVAISPRLAVQQAAQRRGVESGIAAAQILKAVRHQPGVPRDQLCRAVRKADGGEIAGAGDRKFIQPFRARYDQGGFAAQQLHRIAVQRDQRGVRYADQLAGDPGGIGKRAGQVENRAPPQAFADRGNPGQRRMVLLRKKEGDAQIGQGRLGQFAGALEVQPQRFERIGAAGQAGSGTVAVLGHRHVAGRHHQRHRGGDVE